MPQADPSGREKNEIIEGRVTGGEPGEMIVLYAKDEKWWIQPLELKTYTQVGPNSTWINSTHLGTDYAALLVKKGFAPPLSMNQLPTAGGSIYAVASVKGQRLSPSTYLSFCGYEWRVRDSPSARGGNNLYSTRNAWIDRDGALHLSLSKSANRWTCAEVSLTRSLGYGTYSFIVRDTSKMEPSAVLDMFTYDYSQPDQNYGEMNVEITRWGDPASENGQYVVQPWYQGANVSRFSAPSGLLKCSLRWERGRVLFETGLRSLNGSEHPVSKWAFTVGVPEPGIESVRISLYAFLKGKVPLVNGTEIVVDKFEYRP